MRGRLEQHKDDFDITAMSKRQMMTMRLLGYVTSRLQERGERRW